MSGHLPRRVRLSLIILVIPCLIAAISQFRALAYSAPGIAGVIVSQFNCGNFAFQSQTDATSGYAAVRIWVNNPSGTPIYDSFVPGYPSYYTSLGSPYYGAGAVTFVAQPIGTTLYARVYRALSPQPGSWDGGHYTDKTITCTNGINQLQGANLDCDSFTFGVSGYPGSGYAAVRIWVNGPGGTPIVDSYVAGYPEYYKALAGNGQANGTLNFAAQSNGTTLYARVYRALSPQPGSWDGGQFVDFSAQCQLPLYTATPHS